MKPSVFDFRSGRVVHWELEVFDEDAPIDGQLDELREDLAQVEYPSAVLLDIGWYPEFNAAGQFTVSVVREGDWEFPIFCERAALGALRNVVSRAVKAADLSSTSPELHAPPAKNSGPTSSTARRPYDHLD